MGENKHNNVENEGNDKFWTFLLVFLGIFLFMLILIYVCSLGTINLVPNTKEGNGFKEKRKLSEEEAKRLEEELKKNKKMARRYGRIYSISTFLLRFVELGLVVCFNIFFIIFYMKITSASEILAWNTLAALSLGLLAYLFTGNFTEIKNIAGFYNNTLKIWIYGAAVNIHKIISKQKELLEESKK